MNPQSRSVKPQVYRKSTHTIVNARIDHDALKIIARLKRSGYIAYIVGGGVRDLLLKKVPKDFDIATSATPRQVKALFKNCRIIGRRFKLAHIFFRGNKIIEVSTFRDAAEFEDAVDETDSNITLANDNFYGTEHTDAIRRDLTINALFYDPLTYSIIDYVGGIKDLREGVIRVIGDPRQRFVEDPVRMLRAIRHAARTGFSLCPKCAVAINAQHALIEKCPAMRVFEELKKDLVSGYCQNILFLMQQNSILEHFLPQFCSKSTSTVWSDESYFIQSLRRIDASSEQNREISLTAVLAVLCLFTWQPAATAETILKLDMSAEDLSEAIAIVFQKLAAPRKEREKISLIIRDAIVRINQSSNTKSKRKSNLAFECNCLLYYLGLQDADLSLRPSENPRYSNRRRQFYRNRATR